MLPGCSRLHAGRRTPPLACVLCEAPVALFMLRALCRSCVADLWGLLRSRPLYRTPSSALPSFGSPGLRCTFALGPNAKIQCMCMLHGRVAAGAGLAGFEGEELREVGRPRPPMMGSAAAAPSSYAAQPLPLQPQQPRGYSTGHGGYGVGQASYRQPGYGPGHGHGGYGPGQAGMEMGRGADGGPMRSAAGVGPSSLQTPAMQGGQGGGLFGGVQGAEPHGLHQQQQQQWGTNVFEQHNAHAQQLLEEQALAQRRQQQQQGQQGMALMGLAGQQGQQVMGLAPSGGLRGGLGLGQHAGPTQGVQPGVGSYGGVEHAPPPGSFPRGLQQQPLQPAYAPGMPMGGGAAGGPGIPRVPTNRFGPPPPPAMGSPSHMDYGGAASEISSPAPSLTPAGPCAAC